MSVIIIICLTDTRAHARTDTEQRGVPRTERQTKKSVRAGGIDTKKCVKKGETNTTKKSVKAGETKKNARETKSVMAGETDTTKKCQEKRDRHSKEECKGRRDKEECKGDKECNGRRDRHNKEVSRKERRTQQRRV